MFVLAARVIVPEPALMLPRLKPFLLPVFKMVIGPSFVLAFRYIPPTLYIAPEIELPNPVTFSVMLGMFWSCVLV